MSKSYDVIIAGAGPVGRFLACELALAKASVLVVKRDLQTDCLWKQIRRYDRPVFFQKAAGTKFAGHFAGIMLNADKLDLNRWEYRLPDPTLKPGPTTIHRVEAALNERAEDLGVKILRGNGVTKIVAQDVDSVTIKAGENQSFRGKWLVGCDGGRSAVRKAAGFDSVGIEAKFAGFHHPKAGMYIVSPNSLHIMDFDGGAFDRTQEITIDHLGSILSNVSGMPDMKNMEISKIHITSAFTNRCKQATTYNGL